MKTFFPKLVIMTIITIYCNIVNAQWSVEYIKGDFQFLKNEKSINILFDWDSIAVAEFKTEAEYINMKVTEHNTAHPGKGDAWLKEWNENKTKYYEPAFVGGVNRKLAKFVQFNPNQKDTKYTMIVKTTYIMPGHRGDPLYNFGGLNAQVILNVTVIETENRQSKPVTLTMNRPCEVVNYNYTSQKTLEALYILLGRELSKFIYQNVYKN
jgi:hypothetical protein